MSARLPAQAGTCAGGNATQREGSTCIDGSVWQQVETLIREEWSWEQIVDRHEDEQGFVSFMSGFTNMSKQTSAQAAICNGICAVKNKGANRCIQSFWPSAVRRQRLSVKL